MHNIIEQYKDAAVNIIGIIGSMAMLTYGCLTYRSLIEQMFTTIFYK
ncbi:MAG: hypothetical protein IJB96_03460 [Lachnospira sp.]|nr:hypothetical protein [Lachnospira sp.]